MPDSFELESGPEIPADVVTRVREILRQEQVTRFLPQTPQYRIRIEAVLPAGIRLAAAHANWQPGYLEQLQGLPPYAKQPADATTPDGVVRVACECVERHSGGMSSYYGFDGYFVSLLVSLHEGSIWDARLETAS
jgi:hypothetical protein